MKHRNNLESRIARGLAAVTLVVVLGVVAVITEPAMTSWQGVDAAAVATTDAAPVATDGDYFPSHYPAPTSVAEPMPTF